MMQCELCSEAIPSDVADFAQMLFEEFDEIMQFHNLDPERRLKFLCPRCAKLLLQSPGEHAA